MTYDAQDFKIPLQSADYAECSLFATAAIEAIVEEAIDRGDNKIFINTNLKLGLPMENINKIAGPFVEAWAAQTFYAVLEDGANKYSLINVEAVQRLHMADVILQFKKERKVESGVTAEVDVKATAEDIGSSGKSPNITSYARIRTAYVEEPDYIFVVLSLKHGPHGRSHGSCCVQCIRPQVSLRERYKLQPCLGNGSDSDSRHSLRQA